MSGNVSDRTTVEASAQDSARPNPQRVMNVGDWLVTFGDVTASLPIRTPDARWQTDRQVDGAQWRLTRPSTGWQGMPALQVETSEWTAWLLGEFYCTPNPAQTVTDVLEKRTPADRLNGHFLLVAAHHPTGELHIWTNRHATLHAYLATNGARTAVGSYMRSVAAAADRTELDWEGLTSFFGFGFFAADRTQFQGVRILRPATHYRLDGRGRLLAEERYWQWQHAPDDSRSYDETLEEFAGLFTAVMHEMMVEGRIAFPISGGLDSRSTIATIPPGRADHDRFWTFSYGYDIDSIETEIGGRIATARSLPHSQYIIKSYLFERLGDVIASIEGFQDVTMARQAAITADIHHHADRVIAAHWGDVYLDDMGFIPYGPGPLPRDLMVEKALVKFSRPYGELLDLLCLPHLSQPKPEDVLRGFIADEMNRLPSIAEPDFLIKVFKTEQWSARWTTASIRAFQAAAFPRLPFYNTRITDFFQTVPTRFVTRRRLQIDYLKRYAPDLAAVTWQVTGTNLFKVGQPDPLEFARRAVKKGHRVLSGRRIIERNWEVQFLNPAGRRGLEHWLLRPGLQLHNFVSPKRLRSEIATFYASPWAAKRSYPISMLLTFSAWLEHQGGVSEVAQR